LNHLKLTKPPSKIIHNAKLSLDQYEKNGETRYSTKIVVDEFKGTVQFLDKKSEGSEPKKTAKVTTPAVETASDFDDDIPF
jgi:single-stranded DNA-binding protein